MKPTKPFGAGGSRNARPVRGRAAFTLLELLLAAAISILLVTLLLGVLQGISSNYLRTKGGIMRQGNVAFALDQMVQDLESLVVPHFVGDLLTSDKKPGEALRLTPETVEAANNDAWLTLPDTNAAWLTLLATTTDDDPSASPNNFNGATRAISYRLACKNTIDEKNSQTPPLTYALYRVVAPSLLTFTDALKQTDAQNGFWPLHADPPDPKNPKYISLPTRGIDCLLAENVVAFSVRFLKADGTWTLPGSKIRIGRDGTTVEGVPVEGGFKRAEVTITVLSQEGSQRVADRIMSLSQAITRYGRTSVRQTSRF